MRSLKIRAATINDLSSIIKIRSDSLTAEELEGFSIPGYTAESYRKELQNLWIRDNRLLNNFEVFVAEKNGRIVGFIVSKVESNCGYIDNILISKKDQKKE